MMNEIEQQLRRELDLEWMDASYSLNPAEQEELHSLRLQRAARFDRDPRHKLDLEWVFQVGGFRLAELAELEALRVCVEERVERGETRLRALVPLLDQGRLDAAQREEYDALLVRAEHDCLTRFGHPSGFYWVLNLAYGYADDLKRLLRGGGVVFTRGAVADPIGSFRVLPFRPDAERVDTGPGASDPSNKEK